MNKVCCAPNAILVGLIKGGNLGKCNSVEEPCGHQGKGNKSTLKKTNKYYLAFPFFDVILIPWELTQTHKQTVSGE